MIRKDAVTRRQWAIAGASAALSALGWLPLGASGLRWLTYVLTALGVWLVLDVARETLRTRLPGKLLLVGSMSLLYWAEAYVVAAAEPAFLGPAIMPLPEATMPLDLVGRALFYTGIFQLLLLVGYSLHVPVGRRASRVLRLRADVPAFPYEAICIALAYVTFVPLVLAYDGDVVRMVQGVLGARTGEVRPTRAIGSLEYLVHVGWAGTAFLVAAAVAADGRRRYGLLLAALPPILPIFLSGSRINLLFVLIPAAIVLLRRMQRPSRREMLVVAGMGLAVLVAVTLQLAARSTGWSDLGSLNWPNPATSLMLGQFTGLVFALHLVPSLHGFFQEPATPYFILHWIPRGLWPGKPIMESWTYYNDAYVQGQVFNVTPSIIGQYWINWGVWGIIAIALWIGLLSSLLDRAVAVVDARRQVALLTVLGIFATFLFASFRFYSPIYMTMLPFGILAAVFLLTRRAPAEAETEASVAGASEAR